MHKAFGASIVFVACCVAAKAQSPASSHRPLTIEQLWTLDATYSDPLHGVSFRYPSAWERNDSFGYVPPALQNPIAGFGYDTGGFPRRDVTGPYANTNLEGFGIVYFAVPSVTAAHCRREAYAVAHGRAHSTVMLKGRRFAVYEVDEGQLMNQSTSGTLYVTYANASCYLFETTVSAASLAVLDDIVGTTEAQDRFIDAHLKLIMRTVRIGVSQR
jgi:hypothetical protein